MKNLFFPFTLFIITGFANAQDTAIVYFDSNKSELKTDAVKKLDSLLATLQPTNSYHIIISGHCDNTGNDIPNQKLSEKRANTVSDYFFKKVSQKNITANGFGETNPVASNNNEAGKAKNRRVEVIVNISRLVPKDTTIIASEYKKTFNEKNTLTDLTVGKTIVLKNLNFEGGTAVLLPEGKPTLEMLLKTMQDNPTLEIEIGGHVCCYDDMPLSVYRAESVYKYLIRKGISRERMTYKGYSRKKPLVEDDSNETNARLNRRVEITVIKK